MDFHRRFTHGELVEQDSIDFPDSLKYETPGGRIVYGGGGIMPDYFIPYDTTDITPSLMNLARSAMYSFALEYSDNNRESLSSFSTAQQIADYLEDGPLLSEFLAYAKQKGVRTKADEIKVSREIILTQIEAYICRNILDNDGFYPIIHRIDSTLKSALEIIDPE